MFMCKVMKSKIKLVGRSHENREVENLLERSIFLRGGELTWEKYVLERWRTYLGEVFS